MEQAKLIDIFNKNLFSVLIILKCLSLTTIPWWMCFVLPALDPIRIIGAIGAGLTMYEIYKSNEKNIQDYLDGKDNEK